MTYCRYCLNDIPEQDMYAPKTCNKCHKQHLNEGAVRAKKRRQTRKSRKKHPIKYYFMRSRIMHKPFPGDEAALINLFRRVLSVNKYSKTMLSIDHIIPVKHPEVSGLTVSWNLQILLTSENISKGNSVDLDEQARFLLQWAKDRGL